MDTELSIKQRMRIMHVQGKELVFLDYSSAGRDEAMALTAEFDSYVSAQEPNKQLRVMMDTRGCYYDPRHVNHWKSNVGRYEKYFYKSGMVTDSPLFKLIISSVGLYAKLIGKPLRANRGRLFDTIEKGMEWVTQD